MAIITADDVKAIVDTTLEGTALDAFIAMADLIVDEDLAGKGLSDNRQKEIKRWLAAHFVIIRTEKGGLEEAEVGEAKQNYNTRNLGQDLRFTRYGIQAIALDTSGTLATSGQTKAQFRAV